MRHCGVFLRKTVSVVTAAPILPTWRSRSAQHGLQSIWASHLLEGLSPALATTLSGNERVATCRFRPVLPRDEDNLED